MKKLKIRKQNETTKPVSYFSAHLIQMHKIFFPTKINTFLDSDNKIAKNYNIRMKSLFGLL